MNDHAGCMSESENLRKSLADAKASAQNFQKQLAISQASAHFAFKAGENAARKADYEISKLNEHINNLLKAIWFLTKDKTQGYKNELIKIFPCLDGGNLK